MKSTAKRQLQELLQEKKENGKPVLICLDENEKVPENHTGTVIRFVDFAKKNEKIKAGR